MQGESCEVAAVCGVPDSGLDADRKIRREVENILGRDAFSGIVLVSDGVEDEQIVPIIQSLKPIVSVVRIVVKHSRTVEETYLVLGRYLKMLINDPRYSRFFVGVPGLIFVFAGLLILFNRAFEAEIAILLILGMAFLIRGFSLDKLAASMLSNRPYAYLRLFSAVASIIIFLVALSTGYTYMNAQDNAGVIAVGADAGQFLNFGPTLIGYYLYGALPLIWASFAIYLIGTLLAHLARGSARAWRDGVLIVLLGLLYLPMSSFALILTGQNSSVLLVSEVLVGLAAVFAVVTAVFPRIRSRSPLLKE
jgi:putative membrane protein